jgi:hypothetical protein
VSTRRRKIVVVQFMEIGMKLYLVCIVIIMVINKIELKKRCGTKQPYGSSSSRAISNDFYRGL